MLVGRASTARGLGCAALAVAWLSCTAAAPHYKAPSLEGAPGLRRVLLCPPNVAYALPAELSGGVEPIQRELVAYLEAREIEIERIDLREARQRWGEAALEAKRQGSKGASAAAALFAHGLAAEHDFEAVILPSIAMQSVRVVDSSGTWDGVRRRLPMVNRPSLGAPGSADTFSKGVVYGGVTADALAASLHVLVIGRDGQRLFESRGGLDFVQEADLEDAHTWRWRLETRSEVLQDPEVLREGIDIALSPLLDPH